MTTGEYFNKIAEQYNGTFDIYRNKEINGEKYLAYGYFYSHSEKYVLVKEVQLWEAKSYEHIIFMDISEMTINDFKKIDELIKEYMEPFLVRKGKKYPEKNHMYSFLTVVAFASKRIPDDIKTKIRKYRFEKNYLFSIRGYSSSRIVVIDIENMEIITNKAGKSLNKLYKSFLSKNNILN
ncbi:hypothetical protein [Fusobacterium sp.]|uniref:hypothetical protein n=1 Tax=Fusobacterium sp. TaxID=68766 RepID=UPI0029017452|nr:hypothetical protein [Fusobacterium sp.]MDU1912277.1 hypothetical protein [Fusobacterium sp.]